MRSYLLTALVVVVVIVGGLFVYLNVISQSPTGPVKKGPSQQNRIQGQPNDTIPIQPTPATNFIQKKVTDPNKLEQPSNDSEFSCKSDADCVLKSDPYCCAEAVEYIESCYHINKEPPTIGTGVCDPAFPCPFQAVPKGCMCENSKCVNVYL